MGVFSTKILSETLSVSAVRKDNRQEHQEIAKYAKRK